MTNPNNAPAPAQATFVSRSSCINCGSSQLMEVSAGRYDSEPLKSFIERDPWGQSPLPFLKNAGWTLVRCNACTQMFHKYILDAEWNERRYSEWMNAASIEAFEKERGLALFNHKFNVSRRNTEHVLRIEKLTRRLRGDQPVRLLDFGCGDGAFVELCRNYCFQAVGVDRAEPRADRAAITIFKSLDEIPGNERFHAITLFEVLEHLDDPADIMSLLAKRIVPNGILVVETPDCSGISTIQTREDYDKIHPLEHINAFTNKTLESIVRRAGFSKINRGGAHVTTDRLRLLKTELKEAVGGFEKSTQMYFRKVA